MFGIFKIFSFFFLANLHLNNTDTLPKKIATGLDKWSKNNPAEKIFLHTDKTTYLAGKNIWYKAYLTLEGVPSILSKIMYIDLVDENGKVIEKQMRPVSSGASSGDILIPKNLPSGNYSINAYSLWMLNFQPFLFKKNVTIYNYDFKPTEQKKEILDFTVSFFPEGGYLVEGLKSSVAFYAANKYGLPLDVTGTVTDQTGKTIASISTAHTGYGKFELTPATNEVLTASIKLNGVEKKFKLPVPKKEGITLTVNNTNTNRAFVQIDRNVLNKSTYNNLLVVAQIFGKPAFMGMVNFSEDATGMAIPKKNLPPGIMQITIFDTTGNPLAERLVFVNNYEIADFSLLTDSISLQPRGKNKFKMDLSKFASPSVSVAITNGDFSNQPGTEDNIISNLLLTSDLRGYIHQPGYYFRNKNVDVTEHLDLLMLTHGWRRFNWSDITNNKDIVLKYPIESGISVSGKVTIPQSNKTIVGGHVDLITKGEDSTTILSKAAVNSKGEFLVNDLNFIQRATVYLQGSKTSNQNANVDVIVNKAYIDTLKRSENIPLKDIVSFAENNSLVNDKLLSLIAEETDKNKVITLSEVKVSIKKISRIDSLNLTYASDMFQMGQSLEVTSAHYLSVWQFLREQVNGLIVEGSPTDPKVYFSRFAGLRSPTIEEEEGTNQAGGMESNGITYYLNEINVSKDVINTLHPSDIALVKVFKGPESAALGINEGGIAIYTKKGINDKSRTGEKGFFTEKKIGYAVTREFYNPDYSVKADSSFTDNRTTLYWNGNLKPDKSGVATIRFYNNDTSKKYKIMIQGIDKKGNLIYKEQILQ
ncbi:MAG: hypothetical protein ACR2KX_09085 [Chitinophagaceae bacterium]